MTWGYAYFSNLILSSKMADIADNKSFRTDEKKAFLFAIGLGLSLPDCRFSVGPSLVRKIVVGHPCYKRSD